LKGFKGRLLRVNLSSGDIHVDKIFEEDARKYLGGRGLGSYILYEELESNVDPLGPDNKLVFMTGPLTGVAFPGNSRYCIVTKSPLTGGWGEAHAAGYFGPQLKWSGFDGIIFEGVAERPVYLWIHDGQADLENAAELWGKTTHETERELKRKLGQPQASVASIGPGGENLVKFAGVINDLNRAAARTGAGAVMGSKRLKAVVVYGTDRIVDVNDNEGLKSLARKLNEKLLNHEATMNMRRYGTAAMVLPLNELGVLPTKNFRFGVFDRAEAISGETISKTILKKNQTCYACSVGCIRITRVKEGPYAGDFNDGPEYETVAALGSLCLNGNLPSIAFANHLCNLYSLDTISTGNAIAFAMECYEKGVLTRDLADGIDMTWGNPSAIVETVEKIAYRKGLGDVLADGVRHAAKKLGQETEKWAVQVKGLEVAMHEPRGKKGLGLAYATSSRGAVHLDGDHDTYFERDNVLPELGIVKAMDRFAVEGKPLLAKKTQDLHSALNSIIMCRFVGWPPLPRPTTVTDLVNIVRYVTGWDFSVEELMTVGERAFNLSRAFNLREGLSRRDDDLPLRFREAMPTGSSANQTISEKVLAEMLDEYYELRGWNTQTGIPSKDKLQDLGLHFVVKELKALY